MTPDIFIGMPVFRGERFVSETLHSIREQTYGAFRVVMSIDGPDDPSIDECRRFIDDERFELVVQPHRLGWPGNFNWLLGECDREYFCYWQQDDVASNDYLMSLRETLAHRPDAALAYTDVQWFGDRVDRDTAVEIHGSRLERALQGIEALHYVPLRGLVRSNCLADRADGIPEVPTSGHQQEFVYLADLAAAGAFVRADDGLYWKRCHDQSAHSSWFGQPDASRRDEWCALGNGLVGVVERAAPGASRLRTISVVLDRLTIARAGRGFFFMPPQTETGVARFVREFFGRYPNRLSTLEPADHSTASGFERPVHPWVSSAIEQCREDRAVMDRLFLDGDSDVVFGVDMHAAATLLLGRGWSEPESWGVWTMELMAEIQLPPHRFARVELRGHPFAPLGPRRVGISDGNGPIDFIDCSADCSIGIDLAPTDRTVQTRTISVQVPDALSPLDAGTGADPRLLGFGLREIVFRR